MINKYDMCEELARAMAKYVDDPAFEDEEWEATRNHYRDLADAVIPLIEREKDKAWLAGRESVHG